jgi:hypothetical protein
MPGCRSLAARPVRATRNSRSTCPACVAASPNRLRAASHRLWDRATETIRVSDELRRACPICSSSPCTECHFNTPDTSRHLKTGALLKDSSGVMSVISTVSLPCLTGSQASTCSADFWSASTPGSTSSGTLAGSRAYPVVAENVRAPDHFRYGRSCSTCRALPQAVRLARYHTGRSHLVHSAVMAGGTMCSQRRAPRAVRGTAEGDGRGLRSACWAPEHRLCAGQSAAGASYSAAPGDAALNSAAGRISIVPATPRGCDSCVRCTARSIALIFDEVFVGSNCLAARRSISGCHRHGDVWQDAGRRIARRRPVRHLMDEALKRPPDRLCCARHVQLHPCHGRHARVLRRIDDPEVRHCISRVITGTRAPMS